MLEAFEGSVAAAARAERNTVVSQNDLLKKAFRLQHRLLEAEKAKTLELQRQVHGSEERVTKLEKENYALSVHLMQKHGTSMPGYFHPEVF